MAVPVSTITAITRTVVKTRNPNLWMDQDVFFRKKMPHVKTEAGERIQVPVRYAAFPNEWYGGLEAPDLSRREFETTAYYDWKLVRNPVVLSGKDILRNSGNQNSLIKIVTAAVVNQEESMAVGAIDAVTGFGGIIPMFFGTQDGSGVTPTSFEHIVNNAANTLGTGVTLGGINKSTETWWAGNVTSPGGTAGPTMANLTDVWFGLLDGNNKAKMVASHPTILGAVVKQNLSFKQYVNDAALTMGFTVYDFYGAPWYAQRHCKVHTTGGAVSTSNRIYFIDTDHIEVTQHADRVNELDDFAPLANGQDGMFAMRKAAMEFTTDDPSRHALYRNFDYNSINNT